MTPPLSTHGSKPKSPTFRFFQYILLLELTMVFSIGASFLIAALTNNKYWSSNPVNLTPRPYRCLFQNYKTIYDFKRLPVKSLFTIDQLNLIEASKDPLVWDFLKLKLAGYYRKEKKYDQMGEVLRTIDEKSAHPYILKRKNYLYLDYLFAQKMYGIFTGVWEASADPPRDIHLQSILIHCYIKTGEIGKAFLIFKELFPTDKLSLFQAYIPRVTLNLFFSRLTYDDWYNKFRYLARANRFSEYNEEKKFVRWPQLIDLFNAEFEYQKKRYQSCRQYIARVDHERLWSYRERIALKLNVREEKFDTLADQLDTMSQKADPVIYIEALYDAANILLINGKSDLSLAVFSRYIEAVKNLHLLRSFIIKAPMPIRDLDYWKSLWVCGWVAYQRDEKQKAQMLFKECMKSEFDSYKIAGAYWYQRIKRENVTEIDLARFPFTFYYTRANPGYPHPTESIKPFIHHMNEQEGPFLRPILRDIQNLASWNLIEEASDIIIWNLREKKTELHPVDKNILALIQSVLFLRQGNYARAYFSLKNNSEHFSHLRLPVFLSRLFLPIKYEPIIRQHCAELDIDPWLFMALVREESFFRRNAVSPANAFGLAQLLLGTARGTAKPLGFSVNVNDLFIPDINIKLGTRYFKQLLRRYNNKFHLALAAYNAGESRVDQWLKRFGPVEDDEFIEMIPFTATRNYVKNILQNYYYYRFYYGSRR